MWPLRIGPHFTGPPDPGTPPDMGHGRLPRSPSSLQILDTGPLPPPLETFSKLFIRPHCTGSANGTDICWPMKYGKQAVRILLKCARGQL